MTTAATVLVAGLVTGFDTLVVSAQSAQGQAASRWNHFSADMTIRRSQVKGDGSAPVQTGATTTYRWEQTRVNGNQWKTVMTVVMAEAPKIRSKGTTRDLPDTFPTLRIEDSGDGSALKIYDRKGKLVQMPDAASRKHLDDLITVGSGKSPLADPGPAKVRPGNSKGPAFDAILIEPGAAGQRRAALVARFGAARGRVGALDQFLSTRGNRTVETLVDPTSALPVEMNVVEGGALKAHTAFEYAPSGGGQLMRRSVRSEQVMPSGGGRSITEVTFENVVVSEGGQP